MPSVLVVDDDRSVRHLVEKTFLGSEFRVLSAVNIESALSTLVEESPDVLLLDILLPEISGLEAFDRIHSLDSHLPVIYITSDGTSDTAIEAMKLGAYDYLVKPLDLDQLRQVVVQAANIRQLMRVPVQVGEGLSPNDHGDQIVGSGPAMQEVFKAIGRVTGQNVTVLIRGESGTGKELVARAIYQHSNRKQAAFLAVNCAAIPEQLLESELFGHEKGAFTGADRQRIGKFEQCNLGTIFLDEIGDMPSALQSKILRVIQEREFQRVGGTTMIRTDVRIVAATNRPLEAMVAEGTFREDLLYRLNGYTIDLPPLRDRGEDLLLLIQHIVARVSAELGKPVAQVPRETVEKLRSHDWPGNVRELQGTLRQALLRATGTVLSPEFLPPLGRTRHGSEPNGSEGDCGSTEMMARDLEDFLTRRIDANSVDLYAETVEMMERYLLTRVLNLAHGNQSEAARILGITRGSLRNKIRTHGLSLETRVESSG